MSDYKVKHDVDAHDELEDQEIGEDLGMPTIWGVSIAFFFFCIAITAWLIGIFGKTARVENDIKVYHSDAAILLDVRESQQAQLNSYEVVDAEEGMVSIPVDEAKKRALRQLINLERNPPEPTMLLNGTEVGQVDQATSGTGEEDGNPCAGDGGEEVPAQPGTAQREIQEQQ